LAQFESESIIHNNLCPEGFLHIGDLFKMVHPSSFSSVSNNFNLVLHKRKHYLSPELLRRFALAKDPKEFEQLFNEINPFKADLFSLGLVALELSDLKFEQSFYFEDNLLDTQIVLEKLTRAAIRYPGRVSNLLQLLLMVYNERPTPYIILTQTTDPHPPPTSADPAATPEPPAPALRAMAPNA
jgi:hypothetical protein